MHKINVILRKEWLELRQQRGMLLSTLALPVIFTLMAVGITFVTGQFPNTDIGDPDMAELIAINPLLQGLSPLEAGQTVVGQQMSLLFFILPLILPSILAAYSIVGEKTNRTLEPVLATPIRTWELLLGKGLAVLVPTIALTWLCAAVFALSVAFSAVSQRVIGLIISPGWLVIIVLCAPLVTAIAIAGMVAISSRVNDPRTAQQYSAIGVVPFLMLFVGQLAGVLVLSPLGGLLAALVLAAIAAGATWGATRLFQREAILTRWK